MKLPYRNNSFIAQDKINNYLLSLTHEKGKYKAFIFRKLGFNESNTDLFMKALLKIAYENEVDSSRDIINNGVCLGKSYAIAGEIIGINGRSRNIKTVWKILKNKRKPSLVTASPV